MIEKGIVIQSQGRALYEVQLLLETRSEVPKKIQTPLSVFSKNELHLGTKVHIYLSPSHPIQAKPWELLISSLIFSGSFFFHQGMIGFFVAFPFLLFQFLKPRSRLKPFIPMVILDPSLK